MTHAARTPQLLRSINDSPFGTRPPHIFRYGRYNVRPRTKLRAGCESVT
jgi:hypothetical protein